MPDLHPFFLHQPSLSYHEALHLGQIISIILLFLVEISLSLLDAMLPYFILLMGTALPIFCYAQTNFSISIEHQNFEAAPPPLPILDIGLRYILGQTGENSSRAENESILQFFGLLPPTPTPAPVSIYQPLNQRKGPIQCSATSPCLDGSCCNSEGKCGFTPYNCQHTTATFCVRDCNAHAMCGVDSLNSAQKCALNLCCSYFGYCGVR